MPDLSTLLSRPAGEAKKPPPKPPGNYPAIIKGYEAVKSKNKTDGIRFAVGLTGWPDDVDEADKEGVDLSKGTMRYDCWLTEDSMWRFDEFLRDTLRLEMGRQYDEIIPETIGCELMVLVVHTQSSTGDTIAVIDKVGPKD